MIRKLLCTAALAAGLKAQVARFVTVDKTVKLETLDRGGTGRPGVLLAGLGNTAHVFDMCRDLPGHLQGQIHESLGPRVRRRWRMSPLMLMDMLHQSGDHFVDSPEMEIAVHELGRMAHHLLASASRPAPPRFPLKARTKPESGQAGS
jgi:hypothetical protein